jgi:Helix-turn-helix domain
MTSTPPLALEYIRAIRDDRTLTTSEKLAAMTMASHAGHDGMNAHPGIKLLAEEIGLKERQTKTVLGNLVKKHWLAQTSSGRGNNRYASVYRLSIPQSAVGCTLDASQGAVDCTPKVQSSAGQGAVDCPTNQPVEITKEILVSQSVSDDRGASPTSKEQTDSGTGDGWEDCPSGESLVEALNAVLAREWPRGDYPDAQPFDARFLRGGAKRLDDLVRAVNEHRFNMDDLVGGMFCTNEFLCPGDGRSDHDLDRVTNPARLIGKIMSGPIDQFITYGQRGRRLNEAHDAHLAIVGRAA